MSIINAFKTSIIGLLAAAPALVLADFTSACPSICLQGSLLVTQCTVDGTSSDDQLQWSQFDLNKILGYQNGQIVYAEDGNALVGSCGDCSMSGSTLNCNCGSIELGTYIYDVTGTLCFASNTFGPICGPGTSLTC